MVSTHRGTELALLSESVQLGTEFEDNWCNPRTLTDLVTHISSVEELDEDRTDMLGIYTLCTCVRACVLILISGGQSAFVIWLVGKKKEIGPVKIPTLVLRTLRSSTWIQYLAALLSD